MCFSGNEFSVPVLCYPWFKNRDVSLKTPDLFLTSLGNLPQ